MADWFIKINTTTTKDSYYSEVVDKVIYHNLNSKAEVKEKLLEDYPDLFIDNKINQRRKDGHLVYCNIYELDDYWKSVWLRDEKCLACDKTVKYIDLIHLYDGANNRFVCSKECRKVVEEEQKKKLAEDTTYENNYFIYKITQKSTNKCYIGITSNNYIWRWWQHIQKGNGQFKGIDELDLTFEVLERIPKQDITRTELEEKETIYIMKYDSINNGFNLVVSNKEAKKKFEEELKAKEELDFFDNFSSASSEEEKD